MEEELELAKRIKEISEKLAAGRSGASLIEPLLKAALLSDEPERSELLRDLSSILAPHLDSLVFSDKPLLAVPESDRAGGEIRIGRVLHAGIALWDFGISRDELNQHMLIVARSGAGKTTLIMRIIEQLIQLNIPFLVFDFKRDYRHLIRHFPQLVVLRWSDLKINILEPPPDVSFDEWKQQFLNIFGHIFGVWHGSTHYLLQAIDRAYEEKGAIPRLEDVYGKIVEQNESTRKMQEYASVVEVRLYGIMSKLGEVVNSDRTKIDVESLLSLPVVLELDGLGRDEANLIALYFFYWIYAYRRTKGIRGELRHVLIIDEAKRIFTATEMYSQTTAEFSGIPPADLIADEIRDFGEAIIAADQEPTKLSSSLKANTYTKIAGSLGNGRDIQDIAEAMDLDEEEREALTMLERGEWMVKLSGRYTKPFLIRTEDFSLRKDVTDEELRIRMKPLLRKLMKTEAAPDDLREKERENGIEISDDAWRLLLDINEHPFDGIATRQRKMRISARRMERAKLELLSAGLVEQVEVSLTGRRPVSFLVPTQKAMELLESRGIDTSMWRFVGNVGFEHLLYQVLIRWHLCKMGFEAHIEAKLGNCRFDVLAKCNGRLVGFEIELNRNANIAEKLRRARALDVLYVVTDNRSFSAIRERLGKLPSNVKVCSIGWLLRNIVNLFSEKTGRNCRRRNKTESMSFWRNKFISGSSGLEGEK